MGLPKRKVVFQPSIFRCYVSFSGCSIVSKHEPAVWVKLGGKDLAETSRSMSKKIVCWFVSKAGFIEWQGIHDVGWLNCIIVLIIVPSIVFSLLQKKYVWCSNHLVQSFWWVSLQKGTVQMLQRTFFNVNLPMNIEKKIDKSPKKGW